MALNDTALSGGPAPVLVTGGAGFIGSNFVLDWLGSGRGTVVDLDRLT